MSNLREVNDDILKDWLLFREDELSSLTCDEDRKHWVYFDEISERILKNIPKQNRAYIQKQLNLLDENFMQPHPCGKEEFDQIEAIIKKMINDKIQV